MAQKRNLLSKKSNQIILVILMSIIFSFTYFSPQLEGKKIDASDMSNWRGTAKELIDFREDVGEEALWTNSMFGGMPSYLISALYPGNLIGKINAFYDKVFPRPAVYLISFIFFFFLLAYLMGIKIWVSFVGAIAFAMSTVNFVWIGTGHMTKVHTLTFLALVVTGVLYAYQKNGIKGSITAGLGLSLMLTANHPQITYYGALMIAIIGVTYLFYSLKEKTFPKFLKTSIFLLIAATLAVGTNFSKVYTTLEYGKYSMRGKSELTTKDDNKTSGLDKSYILDYSYDLGETVTAFIPRFKGGEVTVPDENSKFYAELEKLVGKNKVKSNLQPLPMYWGTQPIAGPPFYFGAVLCFLFVLGLLVVKGKDKWWIVSTVVFAFLLSLGKHIPFLANFMVDYFPGYNKFRDVKNIIVIQQFAMAFLGVLTIKEIYQKTYDNKALIKKLKIAFGITGGFALIFAVLPGLAGDFIAQSDARLVAAGYPKVLVDALAVDRKDFLQADAFRSFIFVLLAAAGVWTYVTDKLKAKYAVALWGVLVIADMWPIDKKYLNNDYFVQKRVAEVPYTPTKANTAILADKSLDYRVFNISINPWTDASTSYFHKSIGGYHGAKMQRYQEMIEHYLSREQQQIGARLKNVKTQDQVDGVFSGLNGLNMLNTKYIIYSPDAPPLLNTKAKGNAWFVNQVKIIANADEEIEMVGKININTTCVVDKKYSDYLPSHIEMDSTATISLTSYAPNKLVYKSSTKKDQLAVFSEIYYPKGWIAKVDGVEKPHFSVNYILRSMVVPTGQHEITFEFKPKSYEIGNKVSFASSLILILVVLGVVFIEIKKKRNKILNEE